MNELRFYVVTGVLIAAWFFLNHIAAKMKARIAKIDPLYRQLEEAHRQAATHQLIYIVKALLVVVVVFRIGTHFH